MKIPDRMILLLAFLLLLAANAAAQRAKTPVVKDYFPLRAGYSWRYRMIDGVDEYTLTVLSAEKQTDGTTQYMMEMLAGVKVHDWYSKTTDWVLLHREEYSGQEGLDVKYEPARQFLKIPLVAGATWIWKGKGPARTDFTESGKVVGPEVLKVPAGTFRTMKVVSRVTYADSASTRTYWYADGVGLVKWIAEGSNLSYGWELVEYSFKK